MGLRCRCGIEIADLECDLELALATVVWELGFSETFWFVKGTDTEAAAVLSLLGPGTLELFLDFVNWMGGIGAKSISIGIDATARAVSKMLLLMLL